MPTNDPEYMKQYQKARRDAKKAQAQSDLVKEVPASQATFIPAQDLIDAATDEAELEFIKPINPDPVTKKIRELEDEVKELKKALAKRPAAEVPKDAADFTVKTDTDWNKPAPKEKVVQRFAHGTVTEFRPYSKETQAGRKKK